MNNDDYTEKNRLGEMFAENNDPYFAIASIFTSHAQRQPLHDSVSKWLINAFKAYVEQGIPLERSLGFTSAKGRTSPAKKARLRQQWDSYMAEIAKLVIVLDVNPERAAEMVEARLEAKAENGDINRSESCKYSVLIKKWYSKSNCHRVFASDRDTLRKLPLPRQLKIDLAEYPEHSRP